MNWKYISSVNISSSNIWYKAASDSNIEKDISDPDTSTRNEICSKHLANLLECSHLTAFQVISKYPKILNIDSVSIEQNSSILKQYFSLSDIIKNPSIFDMKISKIEDRIRILMEIGTNPTKINIDNIIQFPKLIKMPVKQLTKDKIATNRQIINNMLTELNAVEELSRLAKKKLSFTTIQNSSAKHVRTVVLQIYLGWRLQCTQLHLENTFKLNRSVFTRSCYSIKKTLDTLIDSYHMPIKKIISYSYLIGVDPDNLKNILNKIPQLAGLDIKDCATKSPQILRSTPSQLLKIDKLVKSNYTDIQIQKALPLYSLKIDTVQERLQGIDVTPEFKTRKFLPCVLSLVLHYNLAESRLKQMQEQGFPYISLRRLLDNAQLYQKYIQHKFIPFHNIEIYNYLAMLLNKTHQEVRKKLNEHPYNLWVSLLQVKQVTDYLLANGISKDQLWTGLHVVFYSLDVIEIYFEKLSSYEEILPSNKWKTDKNFIQLLLYHITKEFEFLTESTAIGKNDIAQNQSI